MIQDEYDDDDRSNVHTRHQAYATPTITPQHSWHHCTAYISYDDDGDDDDDCDVVDDDVVDDDDVDDDCDDDVDDDDVVDEWSTHLCCHLRWSDHSLVVVGIDLPYDVSD